MVLTGFQWNVFQHQQQWWTDGPLLVLIPPQKILQSTIQLPHSCTHDLKCVVTNSHIIKWTTSNKHLIIAFKHTNWIALASTNTETWFNYLRNSIQPFLKLPKLGSVNVPEPAYFQKNITVLSHYF